MTYEIFWDLLNDEEEYRDSCIGLNENTGTILWWFYLNDQVVAEISVKKFWIKEIR